MNYIMIRTDDMLNGDGLRVVLFCAACNHQCKNCQNPETWSENAGKYFDELAQEEILNELNNDYISGITLSGGDPLHINNVISMYYLCKTIKEKFPNKTIWLYSGYTYEDIYRNNNLKELHCSFAKKLLGLVDVFVDGKYIEELSDVNYHWAGSTNQRVIDMQKTIEVGKIVLYE